MNKNDAAAIAVLAKLGLRKEKELSPEQEAMYDLTVNGTEDEKFLDDAHRLFVNPPSQD